MTAKESSNSSAYRVLTEIINLTNVNLAIVKTTQENMHVEIKEIKDILKDPANGLITHQMKCQDRFVPLENGYKLFKWIGAVIGGAAIINIIATIYDKIPK